MLVLPDAGRFKYCSLTLALPTCAGLYFAQLERFDRLLQRTMQKARAALLWVGGNISAIGVDDEIPIFDARSLHLTHDFDSTRREHRTYWNIRRYIAGTRIWPCNVHAELYAASSNITHDRKCGNAQGYDRTARKRG